MIDDGHCPSPFVHVAMVMSAQQHSVVGVCAPSGKPGDHVMRVRVGGGTVAAGPATPTITLRKESTLLRAEEPLGAAEVSDYPVLIKQKCGELAVAGNPGHRGRVQQR